MPGRPRSVIGRRSSDGGPRTLGVAVTVMDATAWATEAVYVSSSGSKVGSGLFKRRPPRKAQRPQRCVRGRRRGTGHGDGVGFRWFLRR